MQHAAAHVTEGAFPPHWQNADGKFRSELPLEPHHPLDGVTLHHPAARAQPPNPSALEWLVPGMIREKLQLLIKALPKQIRPHLRAPCPSLLPAFWLPTRRPKTPIQPQLAQAIAKSAGDMRLLEQIDMAAWQAFRLPEHSYFNVRVIDRTAAQSWPWRAT